MEYIQQDLDFSLTALSVTLFVFLENMDKFLIILALTVIQVVMDVHQLQSTVLFAQQIILELLVLISALMTVVADIMEIQALNFAQFVLSVVLPVKIQAISHAFSAKMLQEFPIISTMAVVYQFVHRDNMLIIVPVIALASHVHLHVPLALTHQLSVSVVKQVII